MQKDGPNAPSEVMAFVAHDPATGRAVGQVPDHPDFQETVGKVVVAWMKSGAKVEYVAADPSVASIDPQWVTLTQINDVRAAVA